MHHTKKYICFFFVLLFVTAFSPSLMAAKTRMDSVSVIINDKNITTDSIRLALLTVKAYNRYGFSNAEIEELKQAFTKRFGNTPTLTEDFYATYIIKECYAQSGEIGKSLNTINRFFKRAKKEGDQQMITKTYDLYAVTYGELGFANERLKYASLYYHTAKKQAKTEAERMVIQGSYAWDLTQVGASLRDTVYMDSAVYYLRPILAYHLKHDDHSGSVDNDYGVLAMTLVRLKRYREMINYARQAIAYHYKNNLQPDGQLVPHARAAVGTYNERIGSAYTGLKKRDSAFYYFNRPEAFFDTRQGTAIIWYPPLNKFYSFQYLIDVVSAHRSFKEYKEASALLDAAIFSKYRITDSMAMGYLFKMAAPIFEKAGNKDHALYCYSVGKIINDKVMAENERIRAEERITTTSLQIQAAEETAALENEKIQLQVEQEKKAKNIILVASISGGLMLVLFIVFIYNRFRITKKQNNIIEKQKRIVESKNSEITQSIEYALRLQKAILPPPALIRQNLPQSFVLYKPKDIVAGDFYWLETMNDLVLFAACDCTGHGVPGAMVSVICFNALNRAVHEFGLTQPAAILDKTAELVIENFSKSEENIRDGMDISLCCLNTKTKQLQWAGANNPLWMISESDFTEIKPDKQPIGLSEKRKPFTNHTIDLAPGTAIYIFSDGYPDQFGGENSRKKLTKKRFRELLVSLQNLNLENQGLELGHFLEKYKGDVEQLDDVLVMGMKV